MVRAGKMYAKSKRERGKRERERENQYIHLQAERHEYEDQHSTGGLGALWPLLMLLETAATAYTDEVDWEQHK